jgi:hypothetical protein
MPKIDDIATQAKDSASKLGIKKFDIYGSTVDETSVQVEAESQNKLKPLIVRVSLFVSGMKRIPSELPARQT